MKVIVPKENVNDEEVIIQKINFKPNDKLKKGDHVMDLETSKTAIEIISPCDGFLHLNVCENDEIPVGSLLFEVLESLGDARSEDEKPLSQSNTNKNYIFTKDAKEKIVELGITSYSFDKKMVTLDDVLKYVDFASSSKKPKLETKLSNKEYQDRNHVSSEKLESNVDFEIKKHTLRKRSEIKNLSCNGNTSTQSIIGITINALPNRSYDVPYLFKDSIADLVTYEGSKLLKEFPELNSFYINEKEFGQYNNINAGFSFDNNSNLKVLSIENADSSSLVSTQNEIIRLLELYESNKTIDEKTLTSSTFTISDLSNTKASYMMPLVSNNQSSIIGITKNINSYSIYIGFDHKVTSGLYVSRYLEKLKSNIESHFYNEDLINYLKCDKCEMSGIEAKRLGHSGFISIKAFDGKDIKICENCFYGY